MQLPAAPCIIRPVGEVEGAQMNLNDFEITLIKTLLSRRRIEPEWDACVLAVKHGVLRLSPDRNLMRLPKRLKLEEKLKRLGFDIPWVRFREDVIDRLILVEVRTKD